MGILDLIKNITTPIGNWFNSASTYHFDIHPPSNVLPQVPQVQANNTPSAPQHHQITPDMVQQGLSKYGNVPIATLSGTLSQAGNALPKTVDPYLPTIVSIMETQGGKRQVAQNNPVNLRGVQNGRTQFINYPNPQTAILGGPNGPDQSQGLVGTILNNPAYADFRQSGKLSDFFKRYTPPGEGNPSQDELLSRYSQIRSNFE